MRREMDCSAYLFLVLFFCCAGGMGSEVTATVYGSLGNPTMLNITPEFQNLTTRYREAVWKLGPAVQQKRGVLIRCTTDTCTNYMPQRVKFHSETFSLEILVTQRVDAEHYEYTVNKGHEEVSLHFRVEVYEQVSVPRIQVVSRTPGNESCTVTLGCGVEHGDNVTYTWNCSEGRDSYNGSFLHLSLTPEKSRFHCTCNTSNQVSWQVAHFISSVECGNTTDGLDEKFLVKCIVPVALVVLICAAGVVIFTLIHKADQKDHSQLEEEQEYRTIYSQVQKVEKQKSCCPLPTVESADWTTIYMSATRLPPDPTRVRTGTQDPEVMTVYASVMPPMS
ncbi:signaling lymphocytic activation molecule [Carettochelys insculpta]|uniref:signaling lymphocytic activation molecule n=1 Tax=Carettochelys insculpta TaxID=44489 RepID=UPI003EB7B41B